MNLSPENKERIVKYGGWVLFVITLIIFGGVLATQKPEVKIEEKEKIVYVDKFIYLKNEETTKNENENKKKDQVVIEEKKTIVKPDGTSITTETKKTETKSETVKTIVEEKKVTEYVDREVIVVKEKEVKIEPVKKDWRLGIKLGTSVTGLKLQPLAPYIDPIILQIDGERRIVTLGKVDLYGGIWVQTRTFKSLEVGLGFSGVF